MMEDGNFNYMLNTEIQRRRPIGVKTAPDCTHPRTFRYRMIYGSRPRYSRSGFHDVVSCSTFLHAVCSGVLT
jgi:hypothetical protein